MIDYYEKKRAYWKPSSTIDFDVAHSCQIKSL